jgi:DNA repair photolyase
MIRPGVPAPNLAPLLGREVVRERDGVRYFELEARSLMNRCTSEYVPFDWTVNPYRGCAMGCRYCYATYSHGYLGVEEADDFHRVIYAKKDSEGETLRRLARAAHRGELVALGTVTDPYQPGETELGSTRSFLQKVACLRGLRVGITTKGALILRDLDLLKTIHGRSSLHIQVSLISLDRSLVRRLEPLAPPPEVRLEVLSRLVGAGLDAGISITPILPGLTDAPRDLEALLAAAAGAGVQRFFRGFLFLRSPTREKYLAWVEREEPRLLPAYLRAYGSGSRLKGAYTTRILATVDRLAARYGLTNEHMGPVRVPPRQLRLFP